MNRPMIVGGTDHDYDHLLTTVGAEPAPQGHYAPPPPSPEHHYYPPHAPLVQHHGHGHHHPHPNGHYLPPGPPAYGPPPMMMPPQQVVMTAAPPQRHVVSEPMVKARDFPIGFMSPAPIQPGSAPVEIEVKPQSLFKGRRLSVAHSIAKNFVIVDIKVGTNPQQGATGEMPAESFSSNAVDTRMAFDTAAPGTTITIRVRNISNTPSLFMATLFGDVLV